MRQFRITAPGRALAMKGEAGKAQAGKARKERLAGLLPGPALLCSTALAGLLILSLPTLQARADQITVGGEVWSGDLWGGACHRHYSRRQG